MVLTARAVKIVVSLALSACLPAPGHGAKAVRGYRRAAPVIEALKAFRQDSAKYPTTLTELVPQYLFSAALSIPDDPQEHYPLDYHLNGPGYILQFQYIGPGENNCRYSSTEKTWECSGLF